LVDRPGESPAGFYLADADYKPVFVPSRAIAIHLGRTLLSGSFPALARQTLATYPEV
jgi:hypothetical protein